MITRLSKDTYNTPHAGIIKVLVDKINLSPTDIICEPCNGSGMVSNTLLSLGHNVISSDINMGPQYDASLPHYWEKELIGKPEWVITNPPYENPLCKQIIKQSWDHCKVGIAMLLRLSWLEPCQYKSASRADFLKSTPLTNLIILNPRPKFRTDTKGGDNVTSAWFVWKKDAPLNSTEITFAINWSENI